MHAVTLREGRPPSVSTMHAVTPREGRGTRHWHPQAGRDRDLCQAQVQRPTVSYTCASVRLDAAP
jgi:hypothetical protein